MKPKALILTGETTQGDYELAQALVTAQFEVHVRRLDILEREGLKEEALFPEYSLVGLGGGDAGMDAFVGGRLLALEIQSRLGWTFQTFIQKGGLVIGVGNGFKALLRMNLFGKDLSLIHPAESRGDAQWVRAMPNGQTCIWLRGIGALDLPMRLRESEVVFHPGRRTETWVRLERKGMNCLIYEGKAPNQESSILGLCDPTGRCFGLLPRPEAFVRWTAHPEWTLTPQRANAPGLGMLIFENGYQEAFRVQQAALDGGF